LQAALAWITRKKLIGNIFLDRRISKAQRQLGNKECWYCAGINNPADHTTRVSHIDQDRVSNWWTGPDREKMRINVILSKIDKEHVFDLTISVEIKVLQYIANNSIHEIDEIKSGIQQGLAIYKDEIINKWMVKGRIETRKPVLFQLSKSIFIKRLLEHFHF
jgi:hypothetical protein